MSNISDIVDAAKFVYDKYSTAEKIGCMRLRCSECPAYNPNMALNATCLFGAIKEIAKIDPKEKSKKQVEKSMADAYDNILKATTIEFCSEISCKECPMNIPMNDGSTQCIRRLLVAHICSAQQ